MTISSTNRIAGPFVGAGTTATFPFSFKAFEATDLYVLELNSTTFAITKLSLTTDYTVALNADQDTNPGGSITLTAGNLATGFTLTVTTGIAVLQGLDLTNGGAFYPDVINSALDLLTVFVQQLALQVAQSLQAPLVDSGITMTLPPAQSRAGKALIFDANGNADVITLAPGGVVPGAQNASGAVNSANQNFTFLASAAATPVPLVFVGGIYQTPGTDYTTPVNVGGSSWQIVFTVAPTQGPITVMLLA